MDYEKIRDRITSETDLIYLDDFRIAGEITQQKAIEMFNNGDNLNDIVAFCKKEVQRKLANKLKKEAELSKRFQTRTFENFICENSTQKQAFEKAKNYVANFEEHLKTGTGLIIAGHGSIGTGKTHLACAIANDLLNNGYPVKVINITRMIASIKEDFNIQAYLDVPVLLIDDLGKETGTQWVTETLYAIINERYEAMKPTLITTEDGIEELENNYKVAVNGVVKNRGKAIISRLIQDFIYIPLTGEDYRQRRVA